MRYEVLIAGMGGQGIVLAGDIFGTAATIFGGMEAVQIVSYGPEARGGRVFTEVIISDGRIGYPRVRRPDAVIVMCQMAYEEFGGTVAPGGYLIYDPDLVRPKPVEGIKLIPIPATRTAEELGSRISANMVMLGSLTALCNLLTPEAVEKAIRMKVKRAAETNLRAFRAGYEAALRLVSAANNRLAGS